MKVKAKCTAKCWDSGGEIFGYPVLCSPGEVYEIPIDGQLANLTIHPVAYDDKGNAIRYFRDPKGEIKTVQIQKPPYIFEFDRAVPGQERDYSCKKCGKEFKSLNALGTHDHSEHPETFLVDDEPVSVSSTCRCKPCSLEFPSRSELMKHKREVHKIGLGVKKQEPAETASVPA